MNLNQQIKGYRKRDNLSQEELAEKMYVSRQSISNWENERSYPDIHNLLMLSAIFDVSLDELVKGDVEMMKQELQHSNMIRWTYVMIGGMAAMLISVPLVMKWLGMKGLFISLLLFAFNMFAAYKVEAIKKTYHLKTYRQIINFMEGKPVRQVEVGRKEWLYKALMVIISAVIGFIIVYVGMTILNV